MNVTDVGTLLKRIGLKKYVDIFNEVEVDGRKLNSCRTLEEVKEFAEAILLLEEISKFKQVTGKLFLT